MVDVNIKGVLNGITAVLPGMLEHKSGHIINIASVAGQKVMAAASSHTENTCINMQAYAIVNSH